VDYNLQEQVQIKGFVDDDTLYKAMCGARALLAPLILDNRSKARFPTKIAEYLATGIPVIATSVGEIPRYLTDCQTAFLVADDTAESMADKMLEIIQKPQVAENVGKAGRTLAIKTFHYSNHANKIDRFFKDVIKSKSIEKKEK
jgi:glycosyltransferase involved in cell wall biosynthesis